MHHTGTVVVGGGQAGLAMSYALTERDVDHVVLERGDVAERWRSERWDSLRLLTPNWLTRLPGFRYDGPDPDGYMGMHELVGFFERYARSFPAPIEPQTTVQAVERSGEGFRVVTDRGSWQAPNVVLATGHCDVPLVPRAADSLPRDLVQVVATRYRNPGQLPDGGVLVVGASATGIQLAEEIHQSGRPVTLAVGRHTRLPRLYRGRDILWWFDALGIFEDTADRVYDIEVSRRQTSLQLVGRPDRSTLDLPALSTLGVRLTGRLLGCERGTAFLADDLVAYTAAADVRLAQLLQRIDAFIAVKGLEREAAEPEPFTPFCWPDPSPGQLDLGKAGIRSVVWATGFRRDYSWLRVPVLDDRGEVRHHEGLTPEPGLYVLGLHFLRRRNSSFIDGVGADARFLAEHIERRMSGRQPQPSWLPQESTT